MASDGRHPFGGAGSAAPSLAYGSVYQPTSLTGAAGGVQGQAGDSNETCGPPTQCLQATSLGPAMMAGSSVDNCSRMRMANLQQHELHQQHQQQQHHQQHHHHQHQHPHPHSHTHQQQHQHQNQLQFQHQHQHQHQHQLLHGHSPLGSLMQSGAPPSQVGSEPGSGQTSDKLNVSQGELELPAAEQSSSKHHLYDVLGGSYGQANENYIAGMSSDSELMSSPRGHHRRPFSSHPRVYHAHPAPRVGSTSGHTSSSRLSHYSNSPLAACGYGQPGQVQVAGSPSNKPLGSLGHQQSTGAGGAAELGSRQHQHQYQPAAGRQLPARPGFKQSVSIDQHQLSAHQPAASTSAVQGHHLLARLGSPGHHYAPVSAHYESPAAPSHIQGELPPPQQARWLPEVAGRYPGALGVAGARLGALELDQVERQAAGLSLYGAQTEVEFSPSSSSGEVQRLARHLGRNSQPGLGSGQLGGHSLEQLRQQSPVNQHRLEGVQANQAGAQQLDLTSGSGSGSTSNSHSNSSSAPTDQSNNCWLPPSGSQQSRPHFLQAMSIDHYSAAQNAQHYPAAGYLAPSLAANLDEHFRVGSSYGQLPTGYYQQRRVGGPADFHLAGGGEHEIRPQVSGQQDVVDSDSIQAHVTNPELGPIESGSNYVNVSPAGKPPTSGQGLPGELARQFSSGSSGNSHSGSLKSSNLDLNKQQQQPDQARGAGNPAGTHPVHQSALSGQVASRNDLLQQSHLQQQQHHHHQQQQHHQHQHQQYHRGQLRKGYTASAVPSLASSLTALNETGDLSSSHATNSGLGQSFKRPVLRAASPSATFDQVSSGSSPHRHPRHYHHHHSAGGPSSKEQPAVGSGTRSESSTGLPNGGATASSSSNSLAKKSNSATQLSMTGTKKRLGFRKKQVTSFSVHRSEEVAPLEARHLVKQGSSVSEGDSSVSGDSSSRSWSNSNFKQPTPDELASMSFIDGLGKGQMISRQGLASPYLGDIQLSLCDRRGNLEVEVIRARGLQAKTNKILPLTYVKLYLVKNRKCMAKAKTTLSNKRTLDPLFQQQLTFHEDYHGCILQSIVWGNFGKMDKKNFMGIAQISIDDLELSDTVISWYKLFLPSSLQTLPSKSLRHTLLSNSTESFTNTNNS